MTNESAEFLTAYGDGEIYENYSGRGMFGKNTTGVQFESMKDFYSCFAGAMKEADVYEIYLLTAILENFKSDSIGRGVIVY